MKEIKEVYDLKETPDAETLNKMDFMNSFLKETLRLYSPAPGVFPRRALEDHYINGVFIKKGMRVRPNPLPSLCDPRNFEEPFEFKPERWEEMEKQGKKIDSFAYIPFSAGARNCIG